MRCVSRGFPNPAITVSLPCAPFLKDHFLLPKHSYRPSLMQKPLLWILGLHLKPPQELQTQFLHLHLREILPRTLPRPIAPPHPVPFHQRVALLAFQPSLGAECIGVLSEYRAVAVDDVWRRRHLGPGRYDHPVVLESAGRHIARQDCLRGGLEAQAFFYAGHEVRESGCFGVSDDDGTGGDAAALEVCDFGHEGGVDGGVLGDVVHEGGDEGGEAVEGGGGEEDVLGCQCWGT